MVYDDVYIRLKKVKLNNKVKATAWNVLLLGIDAMSRSRFVKTMPLSSQLIKQSGWMDYKGYHAVSVKKNRIPTHHLSGSNI